MKKLYSILLLLFSVAMITVSLSSCSDDDDDILYGRCRITGVAVDMDGKPVGGAEVRVMLEGVGSKPAVATADSKGFFELDMRKATAVLVFEGRAEGYRDSFMVIEVPFADPEPGSLGHADFAIQLAMEPLPQSTDN